MSNLIIELTPRNAHVYNVKGHSLFQLWRYEEALEAYDRVIELHPQSSVMYYNKWLVLEKLWKQKLSKLYRYVSNLLEWKEKLLEISYRKEKWIIKQFIASKDYEWLRKYLIDLGKKES